MCAFEEGKKVKMEIELKSIDRFFSEKRKKNDTTGKKSEKKNSKEIKNIFYSFFWRTKSVIFFKINKRFI